MYEIAGEIKKEVPVEDIQPGRKFVHAYWMDRKREKRIRCEVVSVNDDRVVYKAQHEAQLGACAVKDFWRVLREWL
jgi:hypothetical protein